MAEIKTKPTVTSPKDYIKSITDDQLRKDSEVLLKMFTSLTGEKPKLWSNNVIGFGTWHYKSERTNRQGEWFAAGFAPRKQNISIYVMAGFDKYTAQLKKLGKCKTSVGCLYINRLADIDLKVLEQIVKDAYHHMKTRSA